MEDLGNIRTVSPVQCKNESLARISLREKRDKNVRVNIDHSFQGNCNKQLRCETVVEWKIK